jgi:hypothetical protein
MLSPEEFEMECRESQRIIKQYTGSECVTLVYPYCASAHKEISSKYYISARCCSKHIEPHTPADMFDISSVGVGLESDVNKAEEFNKWVDDGVSQKGWCTFLIHGIDDDGGYSPIESSELEKHLAYVTKNPDKFWVATFAQISKFIQTFQPELHTGLYHCPRRAVCQAAGAVSLPLSLASPLPSTNTSHLVDEMPFCLRRPQKRLFRWMNRHFSPFS